MSISSNDLVSDTMDFDSSARLQAGNSLAGISTSFAKANDAAPARLWEDAVIVLEERNLFGHY